MCGGEAHTTNNRMELMAAIAALEALKRPCQVHLHTDSKYVQQGISEWIHGWKQRGWKTAAKQPVKNEDLWRRLDAATRCIRLNGCGLKDMRGMLKTSAQTSWRIAGLKNLCTGKQLFKKELI